jgi:hypothetical protein
VLCTAVIVGTTSVSSAFDNEKGATQLIQPRHGPTARQSAWLKATTEERIILAEALGENGAVRLARSRGWSPILDAGARTVPQGPDLVYRGADGTVLVIEAKGGSSSLNRAYGYEQGTSEWAVKSAERMAGMEGASEAEKRAAVEVLGAARDGKLQVHVMRTKPVLGEPKKAVIEQTVKCSPQATELAREGRVDGRFILALSLARGGRQRKKAFQGAGAGKFRMTFGVGGHEGGHVHPGRGAADECEEADLVRNAVGNSPALARVVFPGFEDIAHGRGGRIGSRLGLHFGNPFPNLAIVGMVDADAPREH